jgi:3-oxoacyl-[acyl-carrier-protein] synthase II
LIERPVVVTGLGWVGAAGCGRDDLVAALEAGAPLTREVDRGAGYHRPRGSRRAALVDPASLSRWLPPAEARRMSPPSRFAVAAARMAMEDAGLEGEPPGPVAVMVATSFGPSSHTEKFYRQVLREGPEAASPALFTECVANAPAAQVAIACRATGANVTITQREAGPLLALAKGAAEVASGRAVRALVGSVDEMPPLLHALLDRFGALAAPEDVEGERGRPFDRDRTGFLAAEGATMLVLEREQDARRRGVAPLARLALHVRGFDPSAERVGWGQGHEALAATVRRGLQRHGYARATLDRVVSGASGATSGDRLEARTLRALFEGDLPPLTAPKGVLGEYGGGFLAAAVLAAGGGAFGPTAGFETADPELGITPHSGVPLPAPRAVLATSLAAGGAASWAVLEPVTA